MSINFPFPSHLSVIPADLLSSTLCDITEKVFVSGETINQEIENKNRTIATKTCQLFNLPPYKDEQCRKNTKTSCLSRKAMGNQLNAY